MSRARAIASRLAPPILVDAYRSLRERARGVPPAALSPLEYMGPVWPERPAGKGWDDASVADAQLSRWPEVVERAAGSGPVSGTATEATRDDYAFQGNVLAFAYVLARASAGRRAISILDWGCGLGQYAVYARGLFPELTLDYSCREVPALVEHARRLLPDDAFHAQDTPALAGRYDLVMASGSLQYVPDWSDALARLADVATSWVYVTRLLIVANAASFVVLQRPHAIGYLTEYPGWFLNRDEFLAAASAAGLSLEREFLVDEAAHVPGAPEGSQSRGFLFRKTLGYEAGGAPADRVHA